MRTNNDQVGAPTLRFVQDHTGRRTGGALGRYLQLLRDCCPQFVCHLVDQLPGMFRGNAIEIREVARRDGPGVWSGRQDQFKSGDHFDLRTRRPGSAGDFRDRFVTARRAIDGQEDFHERLLQLFTTKPFLSTTHAMVAAVFELALYLIRVGRVARFYSGCVFLPSPTGSRRWLFPSPDPDFSLPRQPF